MHGLEDCPSQRVHQVVRRPVALRIEVSFDATIQYAILQAGHLPDQLLVRIKDQVRLVDQVPHLAINLGDVNGNGYIDIVLKEKATGNIRIIDFKTSTRGWTNYDKESFTKTSQLILYKAVYSKKENIPLSKIHVEFIILKRKLYEKSNYEQSRIQIVKPAAYQDNVLQVIKEFRGFVEYSFTKEGIHNTTQKYPKQPGKNRSNCKWCQYLKNGKCDAVAEPPIKIAE